MYITEIINLLQTHVSYLIAESPFKCCEIDQIKEKKTMMNITRKPTIAVGVN